MRQRCGQPDKHGRLVNRGGLHRGNLVPAEAFADQIKPAGEGGVAEATISFPRERRPDGRSQRLLWIGDLDLRLGESASDGADRFTGTLHHLSLIHISEPTRLGMISY